MADRKERGGYIGLKDLTDAHRLAAKREEVEAQRTWSKREWALNRAYFAGNQWCTWNQNLSQIETLNVDQGPKWRVRLQSNQIKPGLTHYVAQLTKTRPTIVAEPDSGSNNDIKAAQMAESLYDYLWDEKQLNSKVQEALIEAGLSGGFWKISWDALAGKQMTFTVDPEGNPISDDELASAYMDQLELQLQQSGMDPAAAQQIARKVVYLGDIRIDVMPAENILLDPTATRFEDATWAICKHALDPDEIEARWGRRLPPDSNPQNDIPMPIGQKESPPDTTRQVYIMYIRPCPALPKGRYVAWVEGPNEILQDMDWPYPFTELPLVKFPGQYRPGSVLDDPISSDARPLQEDLNKGLSQVVEHRNLTVNPQMIAPYGSLRQKVTAQPGAIVEYNVVGNTNLAPQWRDMPNLPSYVFEQIQDCQARLDRLYNRMPSTRDQLPPRADSGHIVETMQEAVADQLSPVILGIEDALARAGHLIAAFAQEYYEEERLLKIRGAGGSVQVKKFRGADIKGGFTFRPNYGTGLPRSREGKRAAIMEFLQAGLMDPRTAMKHLDLGDYKGLQAKIARSEDKALREHDMLRRGYPINPEAIQEAEANLEQFQQQAQQLVQMIQAGQPVDIDGDGQPEEPQQVIEALTQQFQQLQQAVEQAPYMPLPYEDSAAELEVHNDLMLGIEFESYPPELRQAFLMHYNLTMQKLQSERQSDPAMLPKLNVTAKSTVSAPVMAKILAAQGIDTTPEEVAEEPLETAVYDSVDKPDADSAGNDPYTEEEHAAQMQRDDDAHLSAQAKATADMARSVSDEARKEESHQQAMAHAEEDQAQKSAQADEAHQEKIRQARQPKPASK